MKIIAISTCSLALLAMWSCTDKNKETQEPQRIKLEQSTPKTQGQPVQIPMHGTKENSSSGLSTFKMKEEMKEEIGTDPIEKKTANE